MTRKNDQKLIRNRKCGRKDCDEISYAIAEAKFLCEHHYREIVPRKEHHFRHSLTHGLTGEKYLTDLN